MVKAQMVETLFKAGKDAHDRGVLRCQSPYNKGSARYADWVQGWDAALKAAYGDRHASRQKADTVQIGEVELQNDGSEDIAVLGDKPTERR